MSSSTATAGEQPMNGAPSAAVAPTRRAKQSNDPLRLPNINGNSPTGRRWRDLVRHYADALGEERMRHEATRAQVGSVVSLTLQSESLQARLARGETVDSDQIIRTANALRRAVKGLGLKPAHAKASTPRLADYLASKRVGAA
jgi:hypothetical protein